MSVLELVERAVPVAARAARIVRKYALLAGIAAAVVAVFLFRNGAPDEAGGWVLTLAAIALAAAPPVVLFVLAEALRALAELPAKLRALPTTGREHAETFGRLAGELRGARGRRGLARLPLVLWRMARVSGEARGLLTPYAPVLPLASVPFLLLSGAAFFAAALELAVALVLLVVLAAG
jgi:hypothetical protein